MTNNFHFINLNPLDEIEEDCVCRAITLVTQDDYYEIDKKLYLVSELYDCDKLCVCCYKFLLDNYYGFPRMRIEPFSMTVNEFVDYYNYGTYLLRLDGHLTACIDGKIQDTWDCGDELIEIAWVVE